MTVVEVDSTLIHDWESFHVVFSEAFGFPDSYGRNMDAWIDCLSYLDDPAARMTRVHAPAGGVVTLKILAITEFAARCAEQHNALIECAAFVNWRLVESGHNPVLSLAFYKRPPDA